MLASRLLKPMRMKLERLAGGVWSVLADQVPCALQPLPSFQSHALVPDSTVIPEYQALSDELAVDARQGDRVTIDGTVYPVIRFRKFAGAAVTWRVVVLGGAGGPG